MSDKALTELNILPGCESENGSSMKESLTKHSIESNGNHEEIQGKKSDCLMPTQINGDESMKCEVEVGNSEVEYIESENLSEVEDVDAIIKTILAGLDSKDWVLVCDTLNNVRRLSIFHKDVMFDMLEKVVPLIAKSLKNPRSAVCKTAIMTCADIFRAYSDHIIDFLAPLLVLLLLKASQDKRFVCEAAVKALMVLTSWVSPILLLPKLQPYLKDKNPRIRAKASTCFSQSVPRLGDEGITSYGMDKLIHVAASQLSDKLPESREAARTLLLELQASYNKSYVLAPAKESEEEPEVDSWEHFCKSKLSPLSAQAVLRVTNTIREGIALES